MLTVRTKNIMFDLTLSKSENFKKRVSLKNSNYDDLYLIFFINIIQKSNNLSDESIIESALIYHFSIERIGNAEARIL